MLIFDESGNIITDPDLQRGYIEDVSEPIYHQYIVDSPAKGAHEVVVAEYPETGGKDIAIEYDEPEVGHWETFSKDGKPLNDYDWNYPEDWPHDQKIPDIWQYYRYILYTPEQLEEFAEQDRIQAEREQKEKEQQEFLDSAPERVDALETGVDDSYEAIADLGVDVADHAVALDDIMEAIAELGVTIEELNNG